MKKSASIFWDLGDLIVRIQPGNDMNWPRLFEHKNKNLRLDVCWEIVERKCRPRQQVNGPQADKALRVSHGAESTSLKTIGNDLSNRSASLGIHIDDDGSCI